MPNYTRSCVVLRSPPKLSQDCRPDQPTLVNCYTHFHVGLKASMKTRFGSCAKNNEAAIPQSNYLQPAHSSLDIETLTDVDEEISQLIDADLLQLRYPTEEPVQTVDGNENYFYTDDVPMSGMVGLENNPETQARGQSSAAPFDAENPACARLNGHCDASRDDSGGPFTVYNTSYNCVENFANQTQGSNIPKEVIEEREAQWDLLAYYQQVGSSRCLKDVSIGHNSGGIFYETPCTSGQLSFDYERQLSDLDKLSRTQLRLINAVALVFPPTLPRDPLIQISTAHAYRHCKVLARRAQCLSTHFESPKTRSPEYDDRKQAELKAWKMEAYSCSDSICALARSLLDDPGSCTGVGSDVQERLVRVYAEALCLIPPLGIQ
ncbi:hypothetical protein BC629DRAFT_1591524 [Irpex lacteus]|nr:hypothetical protein BC629DRAFT_1591524 [Irpex lacteus]